MDSPIEQHVMGRGFDIKHLFIYTSVLVFSSVILTGVFRHKIDLWDYFVYYIPYLLVGICSSFGNKKIRNLSLLFQIPLLMSGVSGTIFFSLMKINSLYNTLISIILYGLLICLWHIYSNKIVSPQSILGTLICGDLFVYFCIILRSNLDMYGILSNMSESISASIVYYISWSIATICCMLKSKLIRWMLIFILFVYWFMATFYLQPFIQEKLLYGTFNGEVEEAVSFDLRTADGKETNIRRLFKGYNVCLMWNNRNYWTTDSFEQLSRVNRDKGVKFYIIAFISSSGISDDILQDYKNQGITIPLYLAKKNDIQDSPMASMDCSDYVCVFKNDTLIYKNSISKASQFIKTLQ